MSQESPEYFAILTAIGEAKDADAKAGGAPLKLTHMVVGDGAGATPSPELAQTQLVREVYRAPLNQLSLDPINTSQVIAECVIPEKSGGWWIREVGLLDADGDLVAVANCPPSYKPQMPEGSARTQVIRMVLIVSSAETVQLSIDPGIVMATRQYAEDTVLQKFSDLATPSGATMTGFQQAGSDAQARNTEDKLRELVSITDFKGADASGALSSGAAINSACNASPVAYVPDGKFRAENGQRINGLWGPGELSVAGRRVRLPFQPRRENLISAVLAKLARCAWTSGTMTLVGDSISEGYATTDIQHTWFNLLEKMLTVNVSSGPGSEPETTNLGDPARYGLTYTGSYAIGSAGPVQNSLILQDGASVIFQGSYQYVDIVYQQAPGNGTLTMDCNGTPFRTVHTSGAPANDLCSFSSQVRGQVYDGDTYTLKASGGPVELTGIWRLADTIKPSIFASRCARSAKSTQLFSTDASIDSVIRHSRSLIGEHGTPIIFVALGINNANTEVPDAGTTPAEYEQQLGKMFARYINSGAYVIAIGTIRPAPNWGVVGQNYPGIAATQKLVCEQYGVPLIAMDAYDWAGDGTVLADGLHPNDKGNELILDLVLDFLASPGFDIAGNTQRNRLSRYTPRLSWLNSGETAATVGTANVRYYRTGPVCRVIGNLSHINPTGTAMGGPLAISLPFPSNSMMRSSGVVGAAHGFTVPGNAWSLQTPGGGMDVALLRTLDAETGKYEDVRAVTADGLLDFDITYVIQD
mgnify:CR=1 FL=1